MTGPVIRSVPCASAIASIDEKRQRAAEAMTGAWATVRAMPETVHDIYTVLRSLSERVAHIERRCRNYGDW